jgi:hypothetical protein
VGGFLQNKRPKHRSSAVLAEIETTTGRGIKMRYTLADRFWMWYFKHKSNFYGNICIWASRISTSAEFKANEAWENGWEISRGI